MANLLVVKRRIKTAQNVSKTTRAMQMIAASKLKKAQDAALSARPYVEKLSALSFGISKKVDQDELNDYMKQLTQTNKKLVILIGPDKGLCGGLVTNLARETTLFMKDNKGEEFITIGKKAAGVASYLGGNIIASFDFGTTLPPYSTVYPVMKLIDEYFLSMKVSEIYIINSQFKSIFSQTPTVSKLLPMRFEEKEQTKESSSALFEPEAKELLPDLVRHYIEMKLYQSLLESYLSEQAARMLAMQNATTNAKDIISELKLLYNKTRQEKITAEILDIAGGLYAGV